MRRGGASSDASTRAAFDKWLYGSTTARVLEFLQSWWDVLVHGQPSQDKQLFLDAVFIFNKIAADVLCAVDMERKIDALLTRFAAGGVETSSKRKMLFYVTTLHVLNVCWRLKETQTDAGDGVAPFAAASSEKHEPRTVGPQHPHPAYDVIDAFGVDRLFSLAEGNRIAVAFVNSIGRPSPVVPVAGATHGVPAAARKDVLTVITPFLHSHASTAAGAAAAAAVPLTGHHSVAGAQGPASLRTVGRVPHAVDAPGGSASARAHSPSHHETDRAAGAVNARMYAGIQQSLRNIAPPRPATPPPGRGRKDTATAAAGRGASPRRGGAADAGYGPWTSADGGASHIESTPLQLSGQTPPSRPTSATAVSRAKRQRTPIRVPMGRMGCVSPSADSGTSGGSPHRSPANHIVDIVDVPEDLAPSPSPSVASPTAGMAAGAVGGGGGISKMDPPLPAPEIDVNVTTPKEAAPVDPVGAAADEGGAAAPSAGTPFTAASASTIPAETPEHTAAADGWARSPTGGRSAGAAIPRTSGWGTPSPGLRPATPKVVLDAPQNLFVEAERKPLCDVFLGIEVARGGPGLGGELAAEGLLDDDYRALLAENPEAGAAAAAAAAAEVEVEVERAEEQAATRSVSSAPPSRPASSGATRGGGGGAATPVLAAAALAGPATATATATTPGSVRGTLAKDPLALAAQEAKRFWTDTTYYTMPKALPTYAEFGERRKEAAARSRPASAKAGGVGRAPSPSADGSLAMTMHPPPFSAAGASLAGVGGASPAAHPAALAVPQHLAFVLGSHEGEQRAALEDAWLRRFKQLEKRFRPIQATIIQECLANARLGAGSRAAAGEDIPSWWERNHKVVEDVVRKSYDTSGVGATRMKAAKYPKLKEVATVAREHNERAAAADVAGGAAARKARGGGKHGAGAHVGGAGAAALKVPPKNVLHIHTMNLKASAPAMRSAQAVLYAQAQAHALRMMGAGVGMAATPDMVPFRDPASGGGKRLMLTSHRPMLNRPQSAQSAPLYRAAAAPPLQTRAGTRPNSANPTAVRRGF